jgi:uncharacterized protein (TIGR03437 family)
MFRVALWCLLVGSTHAQVITTIAGTSKIFSAAGQRALNAQIAVSAVAADSSGNLYIADTPDNIVFRVSSDGTLTVAAGNGLPGFSGDGGPAASASLDGPAGLAVDSAGSLYIADSNNDRIRKVSGGIITTFAGGGNGGDLGPAAGAALTYPLSVAVDSKDNLYIADTYAYKVRIVAAGIIDTVAGNGDKGFSGDGGSALKAAIYPDKVAVDGAGNVYIAGGGRIRKVSGGAITTVAGGGQDQGDGGLAVNAALSASVGLAVDSTGNLYIGDPARCRIRVVTAGAIGTIAGNGKTGFTGDGGPATSASFGNADVDYCQQLNVALDPKGKLYIADTDNNRARAVSGGIINSVAGNGLVSFSGDGGPATSALLNSPGSVTVDSAGNVYIADTANQRIRRISKGVITTVAGNGTYGFSGDGGPAVNASLGLPARVAIDSAGNLYIADYANNRIRKVSGGVITTVAGSDQFVGLGDGGPATSAVLNEPLGVAVDSAGNLYIADSSHNRIRKVSGGTITTIAGGATAGFSGDGGPAAGALLSNPTDVALDSTGNLYLADYGNARVRKISNGIITTVAGNGNFSTSGDGGPATAAALGPDSIAIDSAGNLYIDDLTAQTVRKVSNGIIATVAGNGIPGFSGDGGLATLASFGRRYVVDPAIAVDTAGNLYIADPTNNRIREVLALKPSFQSAPSTLTFSASAHGAPPPAQTVNLTPSIAGVAFTAAANAPWLTLSPSAGAMPAAIQVTADPGTLEAGTYSGVITFNAPSASPSVGSVSVTFNVQSAAPPALGIDTRNIGFTAVAGSAALTQQLRIANTGGGSLAFNAVAATTSGGAWLALTPASGDATPGSPALLTVTATPGSLSAGTYSGAIAVTTAGTTVNIPVTLSIATARAVLLLSQSALTFTTVAQGGAPLPQTFGILNIGQGTMNWTASSQTLSGGNSWLTISPPSGTVTQPYLDVSLVSVAIDASGLSPGSYSARVQVDAPAVNAPQVLTVTLNVLPAGSNPGPEMRPTGLIFTGIAGTNPGSQDVLLGNPQAQTRSYLSNSIGSTFTYLPASASVAPSQPATVRVFPDFSKVNPGEIDRGVITLLFDDGTPRNISVLTLVAPPGTSRPESAAATPFAAGACASSNLQIQFRSLARDFVAAIGQATTIEVQMADSCGNLIGPGGLSGIGVQATFSNNDSAVPLTHIGNGVWTGTWRPVSGAAGPIIVTVTAFQFLANGSQKQGQMQIAGTLSTGASTPIVTAGGVVHGASFAAGVPIAPGGLISIYGSNLADASGSAGGLPLPQFLNGAQVLLGNEKLPLLYTSSGQMNVQVPFDIPVNTQFQMTVQKDSTLSVPEPLVIAQAQPGIFTVNQQGTGQGVILKSDQITLARPATPAAIGEAIVIYCAGLGPVDPPATAGIAAPLSPLSSTTNTVTVSIGGQNAQILFAGLTPGFAGLYQVNAVVPAGIATGDSVPVFLQVAGQVSPTVAMSIK